MFFDPLYFIFIAPAVLLMIWAQFRIKSTYHAAMQVDARLTGAAAARYILDQARCVGSRPELWSARISTWTELTW